MADERPTFRRGWTWTLIKCGIATVTLVLAATGALMALLHHLVGRLPGWLPEMWARWIFEFLLRHVWFVGPIVGIFAGALVSAGIVVIDAKRGRLTKLT